MRWLVIWRGTALLTAIVIVPLGVIVIHDAALHRAESTPFAAQFEAMCTAPSLITGYEAVAPTVDGVVEGEPNVEDLGGGRFEVRFHVNCRRDSNWSLPIPLRCTMVCRGLDNWVLEDFQLGDEPLVRCDYQLSPTGRTNRLWFGRLVRLLGIA